MKTENTTETVAQPEKSSDMSVSQMAVAEIAVTLFIVLCFFAGGGLHELFMRD